MHTMGLSVCLASPHPRQSPLAMMFFTWELHSAPLPNSEKCAKNTCGPALIIRVSSLAGYERSCLLYD